MTGNGNHTINSHHLPRFCRFWKSSTGSSSSSTSATSATSLVWPSSSSNRILENRFKMHSSSTFGCTNSSPIYGEIGDGLIFYPHYCCYPVSTPDPRCSGAGWRLRPTQLRGAATAATGAAPLAATWPQRSRGAEPPNTRISVMNGHDFGIFWYPLGITDDSDFALFSPCADDFPMSNVVISNGNVWLPERKLSPPFARLLISRRQLFSFGQSWAVAVACWPRYYNRDCLSQWLFSSHTGKLFKNLEKTVK